MVDCAKGENPTALLAACFLLSLSFALPLVGGLGEAAHLVSPRTDGVFLFGIILGAIACGVTGLVLIGKSSLRPKSFSPGLLFVLAASLPIITIRLAEVRRWVAPAGPADFWLALEAVISAAVWLYSASRSYAGGLEARRITCSRLLHFVVVLGVMGFSLPGLLGVLL